ncbi:AraC family transcriptional regulator [Ferrimonas aestuarii]|uniref:AraC family transcriptional regulator n=1 Tax=Ferrimonas aestuarii TaxID=2569539 RepID=A0A4V5NVT5_9GAMM|nr:AraC family transcriptional regulator [Ferrimonas aestuarii]TKB51712.1 AraC family transcriptional regulator [Ferrimonas aestuarii]
MRSQATVLAVWFRPLMDYLDAQGFDSRQLFLESGLDVDQIFVPGTRLPVSQVAGIWIQAAKLTGNPLIGLEMQQSASPLQGDTLATATLASRNLEEACQRMCRISPLLCDAIVIETDYAPNELRLSFKVIEQEQQHFPNEAMNSAFIPVLAMINNGLVRPQGVVRLELRRDYPGEQQAAQLAKYLPFDTIYGAQKDGFVFDLFEARIQNPYWNPSLAQASENLALDELEQLGKQSIVNQVTRLISESLSSGEPHQQMVAEQLKITPRHLQRKLKQQGYRFSELLQQVRTDMACRYLSMPEKSMVDIAMSLGFQDQSNFCKAFKRWQGETPGEFRRRCRQM